MVAVDTAEPTYGEPVSISDAHRSIMESRLASAATFLLNTDLSADDSAIRNERFDWAVLCLAFSIVIYLCGN